MANQDSGWLYKQNPSRYIPVWKLRFFCFRSHYLFYFKNENESTSQGYVDLRQVISVTPNTEVTLRHRKLCFNISTKQCTYVLRATSEKLCKQWINKIENRIKLLIGYPEKELIIIEGELFQLIKRGIKKKFVREKCLLYSQIPALVHYREGDLKKLDKKPFIHLEKIMSCTKIEPKKSSRKNIFQLQGYDRNYFFKSIKTEIMHNWMDSINSILLTDNNKNTKSDNMKDEKEMEKEESKVIKNENGNGNKKKPKKKSKFENKKKKRSKRKEKRERERERERERN